jgi:hypothetical protein
VSGEAHAQLLAGLPPTLRSLSWVWRDLKDPRQLSFSHLTGLTRLRLSNRDWKGRNSMRANMPDDAFTALTQLRRLELLEVPISDQGLLATKEQLVGLELKSHNTVLGSLSRLQSLSLSGDVADRDLQHAPAVTHLSVALQGVECGEDGDEDELPSAEWSTPWPLKQYNSLRDLEALDLRYTWPPQAAPLGLLALTQLKQLTVGFEIEATEETAARVSWAAALAGLVNLEVLRLPVEMVDCWHHWLTALTRLVVLDVWDERCMSDVPAAAAHISQLLVPAPNGSGGGSSSSSTSAGMQPAAGQVRVVCLEQVCSSGAKASGACLHRALVAAVPVLPPHMHLFRGSWQQLQECGVELWPAPVAARLQQLVLQ